MKSYKKERLDQIMEETKLKCKSKPNGKTNYNSFRRTCPLRNKLQKIWKLPRELVLQENCCNMESQTLQKGKEQFSRKELVKFKRNFLDAK